jgi:hypothetical protein
MCLKPILWLSYEKETSTLFTLEQNVYIKHNNKTIIETIWSVLHAKKLPFMLWAKVVNVVVHVWNCTLNKQISKTPYKMVYNSQPNFSYFKKINNEFFHYLLKHLWKKLDVKLKKLIVIDIWFGRSCILIMKFHN